MSETRENDNTVPEPGRERDDVQHTSQPPHDSSQPCLRQPSPVTPALAALSDALPEVQVSLVQPGGDLQTPNQFQDAARHAPSEASQSGDAGQHAEQETDYFTPEAPTNHSADATSPPRPFVRESNLAGETTLSSDAPDSAGSELSRIDSALARHLESQRETTATSSTTAQGVIDNPHNNGFPRHRPRRSMTEYPNYPNQALSALQSQFYPPPHYAPYSSRPSSKRRAHALPPTSLATLMAADGAADDQYARTAGNTPIQTPALFAPRAPRVPDPVDAVQAESPFPSPYLHPVQPQAPKETTRANRDVDIYSGRKSINQYEMLHELGKGTHGKVKLARNLETGENVAIKIVPRFAKKRRLGKAQKQADRVKKEIAILKKALHPNVVSMLEVIDDPDLDKVYLVLEFCEAHEVHWRTPGNSEIVIMETRRRDREMKGQMDFDVVAQSDRVMQAAVKRRERAAQMRRPQLSRVNSESEFWSLEYADDSGEGTPDQTISEPISRVPSVPPSPAPAAAVPDERDKDSVDPLDSATRTPRPPQPSNANQGSAGSPLQSKPSVEEQSDYRAFQTEIQRKIASFEESLHAHNTDTRGRKVSGAESISSHLTDVVEQEIEEELRHVPLLTLGESRAAFRDALLGLEYLHYQGIIHRDLKPENLLRKADHRVKISDFGVSYLGKPMRDGTDSEEASETEGQGHEEDTELAKTVGTPAFYAPELCSLDFTAETPAVTGQIDVWALGVTLFCLIFARTPFLANNEFVMMRRIAEDEVFIPRKRLKAVDLRASSRPHSHGPVFRASKDHRLSSELVYEDIDDDLHDLLKRLFIKDPAKRITVREIKHHPWILRDISHPVVWLDETDPARFTQGKKIEISNEEMADAVIPLKLIERAKSVAKKVGGVLGLGGARSSRRRGQSSATSSESSTSSPGIAAIPPVTKPPDEQHLSLASRAAREREGDHPLSQSVSASPEPTEDAAAGMSSPVHFAPDYFGDDGYKTIRRPVTSRHESLKSASGSIKTVKQVEINPKTESEPGASRPMSHDYSDLHHQPDPPGAQSLNALFGGGRSLMRNLRNRGPDESINRSSGASSPTASELADQRHAEPSVAFSNMSAAGKIMNQPHISPEDPLLRSSASLSKIDPEVSTKQALRSLAASNAHAQSSSTLSSPTAESVDRGGPSPSRIGSTSSKSASPHNARSDEAGLDEYHNFMNMLARRRDAESEQEQESSRPPSSTLSSHRPSSPEDDISQSTSDQSRNHSSSFLQLTPWSPTSPPRPSSNNAISSNSSEDRFHSRFSYSTFPSAQSIESANSSISPHEDMSELSLKDHAHDPQSTVRGRPPPSAREIPVMSSPRQHLAMASEEDEGYAGDNAVDSDESDSDSDGGDFLTMSRVKTHGLGESQARLSSRTRRPSSRLSRKSARSESTNTIKKASSKESSPPHGERSDKPAQDVQELSSAEPAQQTSS